MKQRSDDLMPVSGGDLLEAIAEYQREFIDHPRRVRSRRDAEAYLAEAYERYRAVLADSAALLERQGYVVGLNGARQDAAGFEWPSTERYVKNTFALFHALTPLAAELDEEFPVFEMRRGEKVATRAGDGDGASLGSIGSVLISLLACGLSMLGGGTGTKWEALSRRLMRFLKGKREIRDVINYIQRAARRGQKAEVAKLLILLLELIWENRDEIIKILRRAVGRRMAARICARLGARLIPFVGWILFALSLVTNILGLLGVGDLLGGDDEESDDEESGDDGSGEEEEQDEGEGEGDEDESEEANDQQGSDDD